jgi:hypothetical protein
MEPFTSEVERLRSTTPVPAIQQLPEDCLVRPGRELDVYDLACIEQEAGR